MALLSKEKSTNHNLDIIPSRQELKEVILRKKNNKATTDWKNEILKKGGDPMVDMILPVIYAFWNEEKAP